MQQNKNMNTQKFYNPEEDNTDEEYDELPTEGGGYFEFDEPIEYTKVEVDKEPDTIITSIKRDVDMTNPVINFDDDDDVLFSDDSDDIDSDNEETVSEDAPSFGIPRSVEEEKKREMVDELFQKDDTPPPQVMPEISIHTKSSKNAFFF